jgi:uncharacterized membrane protein YhaH (DUF805 family)
MIPMSETQFAVGVVIIVAELAWVVRRLHQLRRTQ